VLVAASARSGTTLLGTLLDLHPDIRFVGELNRRRGWLERNGACGCGLRYDECPFWAPLAARPSWPDPASGDSRDRRTTSPEVRALQARVRRPAAAIRALSGRPTRGQAAYVAYLEQLYRDIAAESGASAIVETSKQNLLDVVLLARLGTLPLRVVHLHRDPRGVVASRLRGARRRAEAGEGSHGLATRLGAPIVVRDALAWDRVNGTALALDRRLGAAARRLPYDDLVADSAGTVRQLVAWLGLDPDELADAWERPDLVDLPDNHSMGGNRVRRTRGPTPVVLDDRWSRDLHPALRRTVQLLTDPVRRQLLRDR